MNNKRADSEFAEKLAETASKLRASEGYKDTMSRIITKGDYNLKFIADCLSLHDEIRNQVSTIHEFIMGRYKNLVSESDPDYLSLVSRELRDYAEPSILLHKTTGACDEAVSLDKDGKTIASFVTCLAKSAAPNMSAVIGPMVAAKLVVTAGSIKALAKMDKNEIFCLGGLVGKSVVYRAAGEAAGIELARGVSLAAIADSGGYDPEGGIGKLAKVEMVKKLLLKSERFLRFVKEKKESEMMNSMVSDDRREAAGTSKLAPKVAGKSKRTKLGKNPTQSSATLSLVDLMRFSNLTM